jgi:aminoglycoside phosphotransferase (APT) family kinase protein
VTDSPVLSASETRAAESLLTSVLGTPVAIRAAEMIWRRSHIVRLRLADGSSVVLKRARSDNPGGRGRAFGAELAALEFLNAMDTAVAPRLLGADAEAGILMMEDLGPSSSLAHSLLARDRGRAKADLIAYARALGAMHSWSIGRSAEFAGIRASRAPEAAQAPEWMGAIVGGKAEFLAVTARLGLRDGGSGSEIDSLQVLLHGAGHTGLVHGDPCPDNTHIADGNCRIFDFETSGWGPVALDAAYLLAPFPSCWCFASLPAAVAGPALRAYRDEVASAGINLGPEWDAAMTAALAGWVVARAGALGRALDDDRDWGTTTMRPRMLTWLRSFIGAAELSGALPRLRSLASAIHDELSLRWPETDVPDYPALVRPGVPLARLPRGWEAS